jgi:sugar lactone lactonase YvrE
MSTRRRSLTLILGLVLGLTAVVVPVTSVGAHGSTRDLPERIDLPDGFQPEGIESWGPWLFAGSLANGAIWRGSALTGEGQLLVPGVAGRVAVGLHLDRWGRLWVAGGPTGTIRVYQARTGELLQTYTFSGTGFLNDLDISRQAVYATDSLNAQLAVVPLGRHGRLPDPSAAHLMPLTGDFEQAPGFNANGIAARGGWLILVQSVTGFLFKVDPRTGETHRIDTGGYLVTNGDGLERRGRTLYVVRNRDNLVAVFRLSRGLRHARLIGEITEPAPGALSVPTTATTTLKALWVVNARFGTPPTPDTEYWITRLPLRP